MSEKLMLRLISYLVSFKKAKSRKILKDKITQILYYLQILLIKANLLEISLSDY